MTPTKVLHGMYAHLAAVVFLHTALIIPPQTLSHTKLALVFLPPIWSCHIYSWSVGLGFLAAVQALLATELLLFRSPREKFSLIHRTKSRSVSFAKAELDKKTNKDRNENPEFDLIWKEPYPSTFWKRFNWALKLQVSLRYLGWDLGDGKATEKSRLIEKETSRFWWLVRSLLMVGVCILVFDATNLYQQFDPYFQIETDIDETLPRRLASFLGRYRLGFLPPRLVRILVLGVQQYVTFASMHTFCAIIHVALGGIGVLGDFWGGMENWPPLMGSPFAIVRRGLRGFWGQFWHQLFRNMLTSPGRVLAKALGASPKSMPAYGIQVASAFFVSGALHAATLPRGISVSPLRYAAFFWIQGVCVVAEAIIEQVITKRVGTLKSPWMRLGLAVARLLWVATILYYSAPVIVDELTRVSRKMGLRPVWLLSRLVR